MFSSANGLARNLRAFSVFAFSVALVVGITRAATNISDPATGEVIVNAADGPTVDTQRADEQTAPTVARDPSGNYVVAWVSPNTSILLANDADIFMQRYNQLGAVQGAQTRVNGQGSAADIQLAPSVAMDASGNFTIAWAANDGTTPVNNDIFLQQYSANGTARGQEVAVNTTTANTQDVPVVAMAPNGNAVVVWQSSGQDGQGTGIYARRFTAGTATAAPAPAGAEFLVNTTTDNSQRNPAVAMDVNGNFVVAWQSSLQDGDANGIYAQRFQANGTKVGGEIQVNATTAGDQTDPSIGMAADGSFTVAWSSGGDIYARQFSNAGQALQASDIAVNTVTNGVQSAPTVAVDASGDIAISWQSDGEDGSGLGVYARTFDAFGAGRTPFLVNGTTGSNQSAPSAAVDADGDLIVVWQGNGPDDATGIFSRRFAGPENVDLSILKTMTTPTTDPVTAGNMITYTIAVTNNHSASNATGNTAVDAGVGNATNVQVTDVLPAGLTYSPGLPSQSTWSCSPSGQTVTCSNSALIAAGATSSFTIQATSSSAAPAGHMLNNTATISRSDQFDNDASDNSSTEQTAICAQGDTSGAFTVDPVEKDEPLSGTGSVNVVINRGGDANSCGVASVSYATVEGTAKAGADYTAQTGTITFADGELSKTITVQLLSDGLDEANETFNLVLSNPTRGTITNGTGQVTIKDVDDKPKASFAVAASETTEAATSTTFDVVVNLDKVSGRNVSIPFTVSGTAANGGGVSDYSIVNSPLVINAGSSTGNIRITLVADTRDEPDETVILTMGSDVTFDQGDFTAHTVTIHDDDAPPTVQFAVAASSDSENTATKTIAVTLSPASGQAVKVNFSAGGTATSGADYNFGSTSVTFPACTSSPCAAVSTSQNITLNVVNDTADEDDETVEVTLEDPPATDALYQLGTNKVHTHTILDQDVPPTVTFAAATSSVSETGGSKTIQVNLAPASAKTVSVPYTVAPGSTGASEFAISAGASPLVFAPGEMVKTITVAVSDDTLDEDNDVVTFTLGTPTNGSLGTPAQSNHALTITDDDATPTVKFTAAAQTVPENVGTATATLQLSTVSARDVRVPLTTNANSPGDYTISPSTVTIPAGSTTANVTFTIVNDAVIEPAPDEQATAAIGSAVTGTANAPVASTAPATHTVSIQDDDEKPNAFFSVATSTKGENGTTATVIVSLTRAVDAAHDPIVVSFTNNTGTATPGAGNDFTNSPTSQLIFSEGDSSKTITVTLADDQLDEADETAVFKLSAVNTNGTIDSSRDTHTLTITDNDAAGVTFAPSGGGTSVTEGGATDTYTVVLNSQPTADVTVSLSYGADLTTDVSTLTFTTANWNSPQTVTVTGFDDALAEGAETALISHGVSSVDMTYNALDTSGYKVSVDITDNDVAGLAITETGGSTAVTEGGATDTYTIALTTQPTQDVTVNIGADAQVTTSATSLTFTSGNWNVPQTVTVTAVDDNSDEASPHKGMIVHSSTSGDSNYSGLTGTTLQPDVTDNDAAGLLFNKASVSVSEFGAGDSYTVRLATQPTADVTVTLDIGDQLTASQTTLTFNAVNWNLEQTVSVGAVDDSIDETDPHTSMILHSTASTDGNYNLSNAGVMNADIQDNDDAGVFVGPTSVSVTEGSGTGATYDIVLTSQPAGAVTVSLSLNNGQALASPTQVSFDGTNWDTPQSVTVTATDDAVAEGNHTTTISHTASSTADAAYDAIAVDPVTVNIADDDSAAIVLAPTGADTSVVEGDTGDSYSVRLNSQPTSDVTVTLTFSDDTQLSVTPVTLTFTPADYAVGQNVTVNPVDDSVIEGAHSVTITHTASSNDTSYGGQTATLNVGITDNDGTVTLSPGTLTVGESNTTLTFTVTRTGSTLQAATVDYATTDGTATAGSDYTSASGTVSFAAGEDTKTFDVPVSDDTVDESDETFTVALSNPSAGTLSLGTPSSSTVTITDDETASYSIDNVTVAEGDNGTATATFTVTRTASASTTTIDFASADDTATAGVDYVAANGTLTFPASTTSGTQTIEVSVNGDLVDETDEAFTVTLSNASSGTIATATGTGTITDDDTASITIGDATVTEGNSGTVTASFSVTRSASTQATAVDYATADATATAGSDYTAASGTLNFVASDTPVTQVVTVTVAGDVVDEDDELFAVNLANATGGVTIADGAGVGTIADDDTAAFTISDVSVTEGNTGTVTASFIVTRTPSSFTTTVDWTTLDGTAIAGSDYVADGGTLTFAASDTTSTRTVSVTVNGDVIDEANEAFSVNLSNVTGGAVLSDATGAGTITDDDQAGFTIDDVAVTEGNTGTTIATFTVTRSPSAFTTAVTYGTVNGTALAGSDYVAANGTLSFAPATASTTQTVAVTINGDAIDEAAESYSVVLTNPTGGATLTDGTGAGIISNDDLAGVTVTQSGGNTAVTEGGNTDSFTVVLNSQPTGNVTITINPGTQVAVSPGTLTFTPANFSTPQTVTVSAVDDTTVESSQTVTITGTFTSSDPNYSGTGTVTVTVTDNDRVTAGEGAPGVVVTPNGAVAAGSKSGGGAFSLPAILALLGLGGLRRRRALALVVVAAAAIAAPFSASAKDGDDAVTLPGEKLSYRSVDLRYLKVKVDEPSVDANGYAVAGSWALADAAWFVTGSASAIKTGEFTAQGVTGSSRTETFALGAGYHVEFEPGIDIAGSVSMLKAEAKGGGKFYGSSSDTGYGIEAGVRALQSPNLELGAALSYVSIFGDKDTALNLQGAWHFDAHFAAVGGFGVGSESKAITLGIRFNY